METIKKVRNTNLYVSNEGNVYTKEKGEYQEYKTYPTKAGKQMVSYTDKDGVRRTCNLDSLVARTFLKGIGKVKKLRIAHKDGNLENNIVDNLIVRKSIADTKIYNKALAIENESLKERIDIVVEHCKKIKALNDELYKENMKLKGRNVFQRIMRKGE